MSGKDIRAYLSELEARGYEITVPKRNAHPQIRYQGRLVATGSGTPGDRRALLNLRSRVRLWERQHNFSPQSLQRRKPPVTMLSEPGAFRLELSSPGAQAGPEPRS